jgi:predicted dinucleotide-binding enzyme
VNIAIIGKGNVGTALGTSLTKAGRHVTYTGSDGGHLAQVAAADVVVFAVPYGAVDAIAREIAPVVAGKVVVDATNPLKADYSGLATEGGPSGAEILATLLPGARIVKAFNTLFAGIQGNPELHGRQLDVLYATDDDAAGKAVAALAGAIGFRPVLVGPLSAARELESLAWLNIRLQLIHKGSWQSSLVLVGAPEASTAG